MAPFLVVPTDEDGDITTKEYTQRDVDELVANMREILPSFDIKQKSESKLQRAIGWILSPFNKGYMTTYATTMFGKIWLPSGASQWSPETLYQLYRHEFIHLLDAKTYSIFFTLSYLLLLPVIFTCRCLWELRGYTQTMLVEYEKTGRIENDTLDWIAGQFTGSLYLWMCPFKGWLMSRLNSIRDRITNGEIKGFLYPHIKR